MSVKNFDSFFNKVWPQLDVNNDGNIDNQDKLEMEKQNNKNLSLYLKLEDALDNVSISKLDFEKACNNSYNIDDCINNLKNKNIPNNTKQSFGLTDTNTSINTTENEDNENSSYDISFKTKQVIEKFFGNKYEIKPSLINKDSKFFEIHTEDSTGFLCVYQTGDFELNISEKENTIKSLFTYDKEGNLKKRTKY